MEFNINLIKCVFGKHEYGNLVKDDVFDRVKKICIHCNKSATLTINGLKLYEFDKREIINDIESDKLFDAISKLNILIKKL